MRLLFALAALLVGCRDAAGPKIALRLWHTFGREETAALNEALERIEREEGWRVAATVLPFGRAQNRLTYVLAHERASCPDLARVDATWLPGLARAGLLAEAPAGALDGVTPEAADLARWDGRVYGVPQAIDGLALLFDARRVREAGVKWPPSTLEELEGAARALTREGRWGLSLRTDAYWFVAFLRAAGGDVLDPRTGALGVDRPEASAALARYAALALGPRAVAPPPEPAGDEAALEARRFSAGEVAIVVGGPWTVPLLGAAAEGSGALELGIAPYPRAPDGTAAAPRGGQIWVVPACAARPAEAWKLAERLTAPALQAEWSHRLGAIPTRAAALPAASPIARAFADALAATRPLPRDPVTPLLFDDLTPAVQAALSGDATAEEALGGVARAWTRLLSRRTP